MSTTNNTEGEIINSEVQEQPSAIKVFIRRTKKVTKRFINRKIVFPLVYKVASRKPLQENKVIFLEIRYDGITNSYQKIYDELKNNYDCEIHVHHFKQGFVERKDEYVRKIKFFIDAATAKYIIFNDSSDTQGVLKKRKGQHYMNTWHATGAFKRFGFATADKGFGGNGKELSKYPLHPEYDMVTVSSPEICWAYAKAMGKDEKEISPVGVSRTDVFYEEEYIAQAYKNIYELVPAAKDKKVLLYAPTFRGTPRHAQAPDQLDIKQLYDNFKDEYVLIIKHHPMVIEENRPIIPEECKDFAFDVTDDGAINDLLCVADICITDYSSLIYEYSIFERPLIFFAYDLDEYFDERGFFYDYNELTPGPVYSKTSEIVDYIRNIRTSFDKDKVHDFRVRFMSSCDGHATERIMNTFFKELDKYKK